jgi:hypothetical protein
MPDLTWPVKFQICRLAVGSLSARRIILLALSLGGKKVSLRPAGTVVFVEEDCRSAFCDGAGFQRPGLHAECERGEKKPVRWRRIQDEILDGENENGG